MQRRIRNYQKNCPSSLQAFLSDLLDDLQAQEICCRSCSMLLLPLKLGYMKYFDDACLYRSSVARGWILVSNLLLHVMKSKIKMLGTILMRGALTKL
mmetsp:Transcript_33890/g.76184  ORF Transcript_33890/g.76184 Transcript_33890/m.76184 type:complete len:97 (+) Transcript_33890:664-954(+)